MIGNDSTNANTEVSSMTASITYLTKMQFEKAGQRESLRKYICAGPGFPGDLVMII